MDKEINALDVTFRAKLVHIAEMLERFGPENVREPYCKPLGNKLWEIRLKARPGIARAIYVTRKGGRIVILHAFVKKSTKTPRQAIEVALKRLDTLNKEETVQ